MCVYVCVCVSVRVMGKSEREKMEDKHTCEYAHMQTQQRFTYMRCQNARGGGRGSVARFLSNVK